MEIHGNDIIFQSDLTIEEIIATIRKSWVDAVTELLDENEIAVYENQQAMDDWNENGWSEINDKTLILVIKRGKEITCVIDKNKYNLPIIETIKIS